MHLHLLDLIALGCAVALGAVWFLVCLGTLAGVWMQRER